MSRWINSIAAKLSKPLHDRRGVAAWLFVAAAAPLIGAMGFAVDVGVVLNARQALQANTNAAALDAAYQWDQPGGSSSTAIGAAQSWNATHAVPFVSGIKANASAICSTTSGLPLCAAGGGANAISLTQTGTVPTYFTKVFGFNSWTVSTTAIAAYAGGPTKAMNVMFVLDTTNSMGTTTDDTGCKVPGIGSPTRLNCAMYGVQLILKQLNPAIDKVGLMVFPGMSATWTPCSGSPTIEAYGTKSIIYQINGSALSTDYARPMGTLNHSSNLVKAVGDNEKSSSLTGCLAAPGGEGTFYADAISAAQTALTSEGSTSAQNVIILLSDGEANQAPGDGHMDVTYALSNACSPATVCSPGHQVQQCEQAVANGQSATSAGTWVYVIAYDAGTTTGALIAPGGAGTGCNAIKPGDNIAANGAISTSSSKISVQNLSNYPWVANLSGGAGCSGCNVYDQTNNYQIGTISSWTGTTITLKANASNKSSNNGSGKTDSLLIQSASTVYDSPKGTSGSQWTPCSALKSAASEPAKFYSTNSSCSSVNAYSDVASDFQQAGYTLSQPRLVLY